MRVMVFWKAAEAVDMAAPPTPQALEAFAAMDRFTEALVEAGVFVAAAGLKTGPEARRVTYEGAGRTVTDGPFAQALVAGFSIWEVKDMDEAVAWAKRAPNAPDTPGEVELYPFYEAQDLAAFVTPEELSAPRQGERGRLGVA